MSLDQEAADHREEPAPNDGACQGKGGVGLRCANPTYPTERQNPGINSEKARCPVKARLSRRGAGRRAGSRPIPA